MAKNKGPKVFHTKMLVNWGHPKKIPKQKRERFFSATPQAWRTNLLLIDRGCYSFGPPQTKIAHENRQNPKTKTSLFLFHAFSGADLLFQGYILGGRGFSNMTCFRAKKIMTIHCEPQGDVNKPGGHEPIANPQSQDQPINLCISSHFWSICIKSLTNWSTRVTLKLPIIYSEFLKNQKFDPQLVRPDFSSSTVVWGFPPLGHLRRRWWAWMLNVAAWHAWARGPRVLRFARCTETNFFWVAEGWWRGLHLPWAPKPYIFRWFFDGKSPGFLGCQNLYVFMGFGGKNGMFWV